MEIEYIRNIITGLSLLWLLPSSFVFWNHIINEEKTKRELYKNDNLYLHVYMKERRNKNDK